ncbi:hypothetical protein STM14_1093 [Salmonella enterica subsp. enterica serovar Typhimurium str. 14028S]|uniref:Uncharacterized protein n=1 Tax=Salmonella typhimurium (strain 14028s / SGSC 2262) TaxID=588858 RepID=A0A0F6AZB3_SALT1|nr:hypothetical protein STM14_1093 [Salmonella enterica subsp. enterica serovar Typhimurium str. 14028S]
MNKNREEVQISCASCHRQKHCQSAPHGRSASFETIDLIYLFCA